MIDLNGALTEMRALINAWDNGPGIGRMDIEKVMDAFRSVRELDTVWAFREKRTGRTVEISAELAAPPLRKGWELVSRLATEWQVTDPPAVDESR